MKHIFFVAIVLLSTLSCNNHRTEDKPKQDVPKALDDKKSSLEIISKRGGENIVESLYDELLTKNAELKSLEERIDALNESQADSTEKFNNFDNKNQSYYTSANNHIENINDSALKTRIKNIIAASVVKYNSSISKQKELLQIINAKSNSISDLHTALKIVKTLPLIEQYQKSNLPKSTPLEGYIKQQESTIILADTLLKK